MTVLISALYAAAFGIICIVVRMEMKKRPTTTIRKGGYNGKSNIGKSDVRIRTY